MGQHDTTIYDKVEPCPFCGNTHLCFDYEDMVPFEKIHLKDAEEHCYWSVYCDNCFCSGPTAITRKDAVGSWNKRIEIVR